MEMLICVIVIDMCLLLYIYVGLVTPNFNLNFTLTKRNFEPLKSTILKILQLKNKLLQ